jgi:hypothetical protein
MQLTRAEQRQSTDPLSSGPAFALPGLPPQTGANGEPFGVADRRVSCRQEPEQPNGINRIVSQVYVFPIAKSKAQIIVEKSNRLTSKTRGLA